MDFYDESLVKTINDSSAVGWENATPMLMVAGFALLLGVFVLSVILKEWSWLNQFNDVEE